MKLPVPSQRMLMIGGLTLGILGCLTLLVAGPGHRFGLWHFSVSFLLMRVAAWTGIAAMAISASAAMIRLRRRLPIFRCLMGLVLGGVSAWIPWHGLQTARSVPPIHDISTDLEQPPRFVDAIALRGDGSNPVEHGGPELAAQQQSAYPDLQPLIVDLPAPQAIDRALAAAEDLGWAIVATDRARGRIEATDTTFWFGFKDDVVIRVTALDAGRSRIDVRSLSRIGKSDLGANARRIRKYLAAMKADRSA